MIEELRKGFETAYIDGSIVSSAEYKPQFVSNNYKEGKKVISSIEDELLQCEKFQISVAFITMGGITPLLQTLKELERKGIPGEILTTNYLSFSEPQALEKLNGLSNITIRMFDADRSGEGFHTKGYIFKNNETYRIIIGSSNITKTALTSNKEWNTRFISTEQGEMAQAVISEFNELWNDEFTLSFDEFYDNYKQRYEIIKHQREISKENSVIYLDKYKLEPNSMQVGFIQNLKKIIESGKNKALLISATGTGKTYASAFAMRELGFKRVLFLVHRGQLARQTKKSYERIFSKNISMGLVGAGHKDFDADYIFATVQTLNKDEYLSKYNANAFDCIIIDEAHHVSANTYQKIMKHFTPDLWLGMTATPDKRDDNIEGRNVYEIFDHQIAYEIRLQQAMEEDLLCPFHYFGIKDLDIISDENITGQISADKFNQLTSEERVRNIIEQITYYGYSGNRVKGLIFCSRIEESEMLSKKFNGTINPNTGKLFRTIALNGNASEEERQSAFDRLAMEEDEATDDCTPLDYIFSVEILNEGVDIVEVNQVVMLRPTQSPIVFIQQLGRGLRKADYKEYVVILDFIGNYNNNFMIPIALSGDRTYNKDSIRRYVMEGSRIIPGASTIHFDEISRKKIFASIDNMKMTKRMFSEKYYDLKNRLGRIPTIMDFYTSGEIDPMLFVDYSKTYDKFLRNIDDEYKIAFSDDEEAYLEFISSWIINGKRLHELLMLNKLIENGSFDKNEFKNELSKIRELYKENDYLSACRVLNKDFINTQSERNKYSNVEFINLSDDRVMIANGFKKKLKRSEFKNEVELLLQYGLKKYKDLYSEHDKNNLVLYQKYSRKDACRILNWDKDEHSTVYGYRIKHDTCPIFVTYEKSDTISATTKYLDEFLKVSENPEIRSNKIFSWMTRNRVRIESDEAQAIINARQNNLKILLFVKKSDGEGADFYYMGEALPKEWKEETIKDKNENELPIVNFKLELENEVRKDIFDYFVV